MCYTSALADGPVLVVAYFENDDDQHTVHLRLNGTVVLSSHGVTPTQSVAPVVLSPGDELAISVEGGGGSPPNWLVELRLYPQGDVAYEAP